MAASGFAGLGYQGVWTQQCALWLGHESAAVLAVVTAFFGGLAVGAWALGRRVERSDRPARAYAACEAAIGLWGVLLAVSLAPLSQVLLALIGPEPSALRQWGVAFGGTFLLLLPATAAMGATLPAMARVLASMGGPVQRGGVAALYASNTLGAVVGVLACSFWLVPAMGLLRTAAVCAALNGLCAVWAWTWSARGSDLPEPLEASAPAGRGVLWLLACTGLLGIGHEVVVIRVLGQVTQGTVYTGAMLLAVYLVGSAAGAAAWARRGVAQGDRPQRQADRLLTWQAGTCLLSALGLAGAGAVHRGLTQALGPGMASALAVEAALAVIAFGPPTVVMGALFSQLCTQAQSAGGLGRALGFNTLGAALAPALFGVVLLPVCGPAGALGLVASGYLVLAAVAGASPRRHAAGALAVLALTAAAPPLAFVDVPEGGRVLSYQDGAMASVSVVEDTQGVVRLRIDNRQQEGSNATALVDGRQAVLPLWLHPAPRRALFLGLGTGVTASTAAGEAGLQVDAVELLPEVIAATSHFRGAPLGGAADLPPRVVAGDARRFVRTAPGRYDVIVSDNFHPARSGSASLYTVEHFQSVQERLAEEGLFCQWLALHQLDLDTLRSIVRSFLAVYPGGWAMLANNSLETPVLGLVARRGPDRFDLRQLRERVSGADRPRRLSAFGVADEFALLGGFVAGPRALLRFAGDAPLNTDDHAVVAYRAPRITYAPDSSPRQRLAALLRELRVDPSEVVDDGAGGQTDTSRRLAAYWAARDRFIEAGLTVRPTTDPRQMLAQVQAPLLAVLRLSPDFRPAYDPLLRLATAVAGADPAAARALLQALQQVQPARPEAAQALGAIPP